MGLVALPGATPVLRRDDTGAVGVGEEQVVELGEEAGRGRGVGVGSGRVREVEEFDALFVSEGDQVRTEAFEGVTQTGQAYQVCMSLTDAGPNAAR